MRSSREELRKNEISHQTFLKTDSHSKVLWRALGSSFPLWAWRRFLENDSTTHHLVMTWGWSLALGMCIQTRKMILCPWIPSLTGAWDSVISVVEMSVRKECIKYRGSRVSRFGHWLDVGSREEKIQIWLQGVELGDWENKKFICYLPSWVCSWSMELRY